MINYGEAAFTDNHDSIGVLKIIFDRITIVEWKVKPTQIMSEEKLLVVMDNNNYWISQSIDEWTNPLYHATNVIRIKTVNRYDQYVSHLTRANT